jgi:hypothetical protein
MPIGIVLPIGNALMTAHGRVINGTIANRFAVGVQNIKQY